MPSVQIKDEAARPTLDEVGSVLRRQLAARMIERSRAELALAYVALAEVLDAVLVTADARLAQAPGLRCEVDVLA